jgi:hypothetical protein
VATIFVASIFQVFSAGIFVAYGSVRASFSKLIIQVAEGTCDEVGRESKVEEVEGVITEEAGRWWAKV